MSKVSNNVSDTAVLAFVPVLHSGYLDFFQKQKGDIYIFGEGLINDYVHLTRDLRTVEPALMCQALSALLPGRNILTAENANIATFPYDAITMPDDEVCRDVAAKYFVNKKVEYISVFLRWNKVITFKEFEISPDRKITKEVFHKEMIEKANIEAARSDDWWRQIATVVVKDNKVLFSSYNHHLPSTFHLSTNGDPRSNFDAGQHQDIFTSIHSEAEAVARAAKEGMSLEGASLYVTTFPCPNCARLIGTAGVKKVYYSKGYSLLDAEKILDHFGVEVVLVQ
ncbi:MAG: deaminase [Candidatus Paceibacterota bacterium]